MSSYKYETEHLEFSWGGDKSLVIRHKNAILIKKGVTIDRVSGVDVYKLEGKSIALKIPDFPDQDVSLPSRVITVFVPINEGYLREELVEGFRYYKIATHYKVLVPQDVAKIKLDTIRKDYQNIIDKFPEFLNELDDLERQALILHITESLVASTGLLVYATKNMTWLISESEDLVEGMPEYLNVVDTKETSNSEYYTNVYRGRQHECVAYVMQEQEKIYGFSIDQLQKKRNNKDILLKNIRDLEIILKVPEDQRFIENKTVETPDVSAALAAYKLI